MNHIADANKMVSDTPRTDAGLEYDDTTVDDVKDFACTLERELNAANQIIRQQQLLQEENLRLTAKVAQLYEGAEEQKLRIKRLEDAGDALYENSDPTRWDSLQAANRKLNEQEAWRKAKEAKP